MEATKQAAPLSVQLIPPTGPTEARALGLPLVTTDARISRRNRCHIVDWPDSDTPYVTLSLIEAIAQVRLRGFSSLVIRSDDHSDARLKITVEAVNAAAAPPRQPAASTT